MLGPGLGQNPAVCCCPNLCLLDLAKRRVGGSGGNTKTKQNKRSEKRIEKKDTDGHQCTVGGYRQLSTKNRIDTPYPVLSWYF